MNIKDLNTDFSSTEKIYNRYSIEYTLGKNPSIETYIKTLEKAKADSEGLIIEDVWFDSDYNGIELCVNYFRLETDAEFENRKVELERRRIKDREYYDKLKLKHEPEEAKEKVILNTRIAELEAEVEDLQKRLDADIWPQA